MGSGYSNNSSKFEVRSWEFGEVRGMQGKAETRTTLAMKSVMSGMRTGSISMVFVHDRVTTAPGYQQANNGKCSRSCEPYGVRLRK